MSCKRDFPNYYKGFQRTPFTIPLRFWWISLQSLVMHCNALHALQGFANRISLTDYRGFQRIPPYDGFPCNAVHALQGLAKGIPHRLQYVLKNSLEHSLGRMSLQCLVMHCNAMECLAMPCVPCNALQEVFHKIIQTISLTFGVWRISS